MGLAAASSSSSPSPSPLAPPSDPILFYDIASGPPIHPFAPNPWKARYALNFKRASYVTQWVDLSEVTSTRKRLGATPVRFFSDGEPFYTLPVIEAPSSTGSTVVVGDSFDIAVYLDENYRDNGSPRLFRDDDAATIGVYAAFNAHMDARNLTAQDSFAVPPPSSPSSTSTPSNNTVVVKDSLNIAKHLDKKHRNDNGDDDDDDAAVAASIYSVYATFNAHIDALFAQAVPLCAQNMPFNPATAEKCKAEFCRRAGVQTYEELIVRDEQKRREILIGFKTNGSAEAARYLLPQFSSGGGDGGGGGPFIGGKEEPDYADLIVGGWLMLLSLTVPDAWEEEIRTWHGGLWGRLHEALEPYRGTW